MEVRVALIALLSGCSADPRPPSVAASGGSPGGSAGEGSASENDAGGEAGLALCPGAVSGGQSLAGCASAQRASYASCVSSACSVEQKNCFGASFALGSAGGPCAAYLTCTSDCGCDDDACLARCGASTSCAACLTTLASCALGCTSQLSCDGGVPDAGGFADAGAASCAALLSCCAGLPVDRASACQVAYNQGLVAGSASCAQALASYCPGG